VQTKLASAAFDLACTARAHLSHARDMAPKLPPAAAAALLPAAPLGLYLSALERQHFDLFAGRGGLGPWVDERPHARMLLQAELLWRTFKNTY
jgi:phytoene/squalene synthetase